MARRTHELCQYLTDTYDGDAAKVWKGVERVIEAFKSADKYVFSVPMWNFGIPWRLKQYIDILVQPGSTFRYDEEGYRGLVTGKRAFLAYARGGEYGAPEAAAPEAANGPKAAPAVGEGVEEGEAGEGAEGAPKKKPPTLFELLEMGGWVMYPIYACSILALAFGIERAISLRRRRVVPPEFVENVRDLASARPLDKEKMQTYCLAHPSPISRIFHVAVKRLHRPLPEVEKSIEDAGAKEVRLMKRNCRVLSGIVYIAPLLGLLGTVLGMIQCFTDVSTGGALGQATKLAEGIYQALVTTAAGLTVAIPTAVVHLMFLAKIEKLVAEMDELTLEFVETIAEEGDQGAGKAKAETANV